MKLREKTTATLLIAIFMISIFAISISVSASSNGGVELISVGEGTAEWTTDAFHSGKYSVKLSMPNENWYGHYAELKITFDPKVSELTSWSYWAKPGPEGSYILPILMYTNLDFNDDGEDDVIQCYAMGDLVEGWSEITQDDIGMYTVFDINKNRFKWYGPWENVVVDYGDADVLSFQVGYGGLGSMEAQSVYVDDVTISGTLFELEAPPPPPIEATIDIKPESLNTRSGGRYMTVYIELPEGIDVGEIEPDTVKLGGVPMAEGAPTAIGDCDDDGIFDLMVKFDRADLIESLGNLVDKFSDVTLTVTGELVDGTLFEGADTIRVIKR